jgi:hypothetical protein
MSGNSVSAGIAKLRRSVNVRGVQRAAAVGVVLPVGDTLDTLLPTSIYIATVSMLDESLENVIDSKYPGIRHKDLYERIEVLATHNELIDSVGLHSIRRKRNSFATTQIHSLRGMKSNPCSILSKKSLSTWR